MYSGGGSETGVENQAFLVSDCRGRSHDQSQNTPLHGEPHESYNKVAGRGSHTAAATNAAIMALAKAFAEQGIRDGVQVNSIVPGAVMTGRRRSFLEKWAPAHNISVEEATKQFPEKAEISRYGRPEEIADLLAFMVSPAAKWMTGTSVRMDGGEIKGI
jgi:NAD(P)-dependent dehydrogenase (short-subunit alcohol dehydrogenase family)